MPWQVYYCILIVPTISDPIAISVSLITVRAVQCTSWQLPGSIIKRVAEPPVEQSARWSTAAREDDHFWLVSFAASREMGSRSGMMAPPAQIDYREIAPSGRGARRMYDSSTADAAEVTLKLFLVVVRPALDN